MADEYNVSRGTVRRALEQLEGDGLVSPRQGAGWTVQSSERTHSFAQLSSFAQWAWSKGLEPRGQVVSAVYHPPTTRHLRRFRISAEDRVLIVTRLRSLGEAVVMLERTAYPPWIAGRVKSLPDDEPSVVQALQQQFGVYTDHAHHVVDAVAASSEDAVLLGVRRSTPLLRVLRESLTYDRRVIELDDDRYLPGTVGFEMTARATGTSMARSLRGARSASDHGR